MAGRMRVFPVTTPVYERWFDVDLVVEDDAATELWRETLRALAQTLRNSGAFRDVREWKLELPSAGRPAPLLHGAGGASIHAKALKGSERRIVLFASHGSSLHWSTGANSALLTDWATSCAVALFHLLPSSNWGRTPLGEPVGRNSTYKPGVSNRELEFSPFWWLPIEQPSRITSIPMVELSPSAVEGWAKMLMARGHTTPATVLHSTSRPNSVVPTEDKQAISRRAGALLSANPKAFQLAVLLSHSPFTIPVARLIQEAHFGRSDHRELCQLFMSGLLQLVPGQSRATFASWFTIHPEAADILRRSLRPHDAQSLSQALLQRVSNHIARMTGQHLSMTSFALDENGTYSVPEWARPFAIVASRLESDFSPPAATSETRFEAFWKGLSSSIQAYLLRVAVDDGVLSSAAIPKEFWPSLLNRTITELDADGDRRFTTAARTKLVEIDDASPLLGARILWVDDHPSNNKWLVEQMRASGARVQAVLSTSAALDALHNEFDVIISDMGRIEGEREGFVLLEQLRQSGISTPVIIFAGASHRAQNGAQVLLELALTSVQTTMMHCSGTSFVSIGNRALCPMKSSTNFRHRLRPISLA
ncbi:SAV_2336 N-terminal domain-related protein (plasmid) [Ensifer adhaerens]